MNERIQKLDIVLIPNFFGVLIDMFCERFYRSIQFCLAHMTALVTFKQRMIAGLTCFTQGITSFQPAIDSTC